MNDIINQLQAVTDLISNQIPSALLLIGVLWVIWILNKLLAYRLNFLGIIPRHPLGLLGIPIHPFLHGSFNHLFFNSIPLFVLLTFVLAFGPRSFICVTILIVVISGFLIWLFGRRAIHIGASGLIMGYMGFLIIYAYQYPSVLSYVLAIVCLYYFGSLLLSVFPNEEKVSWEGHLFGLLAGIVATYLCTRL